MTTVTEKFLLPVITKHKLFMSALKIRIFEAMFEGWWYDDKELFHKVVSCLVIVNHIPVFLERDYTDLQQCSLPRYANENTKCEEKWLWHFVVRPRDRKLITYQFEISESGTVLIFFITFLLQLIGERNGTSLFVGELDIKTSSLECFYCFNLQRGIRFRNIISFPFKKLNVLFRKKSERERVTLLL